MGGLEVCTIGANIERGVISRLCNGFANNTEMELHMHRESVVWMHRALFDVLIRVTCCD